MSTGADHTDGGPTDDLVAVGRIGPARGVHGDVFVEPWTDTPSERFVPGAVLQTAASGPLTVETAVVSSGKQVVRFGGTSDRAAAEALRGIELFVRAGDRAAIDTPDEYYDTDLVGLTARTTDGAELGPVTDVLHSAGTDHLVVEYEGRGRLIPFVSAIVPAVDLAAGTVTIDPPEGLLDL